jgi:hypothetical protein
MLVSSGGLLVEVVAEELDLRLPRHSTCSHEAIVFSVGAVHFSNDKIPLDGYRYSWRLGISNVTGRACYLVPGELSGAESPKGPLMFARGAECRLDVLRSARSTALSGVESTRDLYQYPAIRCRFNAGEGLSLTMCEAQYTVLYFVMTENFAEEVNEDGTDFARSNLSHVGDPSTPFPSTSLSKPPTLHESPTSEIHSVSARIIFDIPVFTSTIARGWDINDNDCLVLTCALKDISGTCDITAESRVIIEMMSSVVSMADVRPEARPESAIFMLPLKDEGLTPSSSQPPMETVSLSFDKRSMQRANIALGLNNIQLRVVPELFRDLGRLAIPGWPFLESSAYAPAVEYLGRVLVVTLMKSQIWLGAEQFHGDPRALLLGGDVIARINFVQKTAARITSVQTKGLNLALTYQHKQETVQDDRNENESRLVALRVTERDALVIYPGDGSIDYVGSEADESGRRIEITAEFVLCRINIKEAPLLAAIVKRLGQLETSALSERDWKQPNPLANEALIAVWGKEGGSTLASSQAMATRHTLTLLMSTPAARILFTDESDGRFTPILEWNMRNVMVQANIPRVLQFASEMSIDLFNESKGWWEPGVELWSIESSLSVGESGARALSLSSSSILNVNVTPAL